MTLEFLVQQNPTQIRVPVELDTVQIPDLPLVPIACLPQWKYGIDYAIILWYGNFNANTMIVFERVQVINHFEADWFSLPIVHGGDIHQKIESKGRVVTKKLQKAVYGTFFYRDCLVAPKIVRIDNVVTDFRFYFAYNVSLLRHSHSKPPFFHT